MFFVRYHQQNLEKRVVITKAVSSHLGYVENFTGNL
jgi:hypothetical protein